MPNIDRLVLEIVKGALDESDEDTLRLLRKALLEGKNLAAVLLGSRGGKKGGKARAARMTPEERSQAAFLAARARWSRRR
ncbi:MAG: RNA-binding protein [Nitrospiraceae bacterium]